MGHDEFEKNIRNINKTGELAQLRSQVETFSFAVKSLFAILSDSLTLHQHQENAQLKQNKVVHLQQLVAAQVNTCSQVVNQTRAAVSSRLASPNQKRRSLVQNKNDDGDCETVLDFTLPEGNLLK